MKTARHTIQQKDAGRGTAAQAELEEAAPGENTNVSQKPKTKARANLNKAVKKTAQHRSEEETGRRSRERRGGSQQKHHKLRQHKSALCV